MGLVTWNCRNITTINIIIRVHASQIEQLHRLNAWLKIKITYFVFHFRHIVQLL